jgi:hypothetical protein
MAGAHSPPYASFYNPSLEAMARRVYQVDYRFLERSLRRGLLSPSLYETLTRL